MNHVEKIIIEMQCGLPIFCQECGEKLTLSDSRDMVWGCSYLNDKMQRKTNRSVADQHYSHSRVYLSNEQYQAYELVNTYLENLRTLIKKEVIA